VLRRGEATNTTPAFLSYAGLSLDPAKHVAYRNGTPLELTALEFELLYTLVQSPERVFRRDELLERVWGRDYDGVDRVVDVHVSNLRQKLEPDPDEPQWVVTVRGVGYKLSKGSDR
jgi:DNA-binding response OmpR family regulator